MEVINCKVRYLREIGYNNLQEWLKDPNHVYIGRNMTFYVKGAEASKWANPFPINKNLTREESLEKYRNYILSSPLMNDLQELRGKTLACWCKPEGCHGDILAELVESLE